MTRLRRQSLAGTFGGPDCESAGPRQDDVAARAGHVRCDVPVRCRRIAEVEYHEGEVMAVDCRGVGSRPLLFPRISEVVGAGPPLPGNFASEVVRLDVIVLRQVVARMGVDGGAQDSDRIGGAGPGTVQLPGLPD